MSKENEQVVELDAAAIEAIAKSVKPQEIDYDKLAEKMAEKNKVADTEVNKLKGADKEVEVVVESKFAKMGKEAFAVAQLNAALSGNQKDLQELNQHALKTLRDAGMVTKATYLNAGTDADGAVLVPNDELLNDVLTLLPEYSPLSNMVRVINLNSGDGIDISTLTADVIMTEVGSEGGAKAVTKPTLGDSNVNVREWAGIALMTKKLLKQASVDVYAVLRDSFARAIAKKREELLLTDTSSGLVTKAGVVVVNAGGTTTSGKDTVAEITVGEVKNMPFLVPTSSAAGGTYVFSRLLLAQLANKEDTTGQPIVTITQGGNGGSLSGTFNGYPFVVAETLGVADAVSTVHAVFGNFSKYGVVVRQGAIDTAVFDSGTVTDGGSVVHNLIQENKLAMRVETWENAGFPLPGAFVRLRTSAS